MDIERLKELKLAVGVVFQYWLDTAANQKGFDNTVSKKFFEHDAECIQELIDEAIARQSVKSEEVAEATKRFEKRNNKLKEVQDNGDAGCVDIETWEKYQGFLEDNNLAITALQAYQPWVSVEDRLPESEKSVLLLCEVRPIGRKYVCIGYYAAPKSVESNCDDIEMLEYDEDTDAYYLQEGYYEEIRNWDEYSSIAISDFVIGWKPLPEPPKGE